MRALSAHIAITRAGRTEPTMPAKARFLLAAIMSAMMVFMVTLVVTYLNVGLVPDFLARWAKAYIIAWPVAATTGFFAFPIARGATERIMRRLGG